MSSSGWKEKNEQSIAGGLPKKTRNLEKTSKVMGGKVNTSVKDKSIFREEMHQVFLIKNDRLQ